MPMPRVLEGSLVGGRFLMGEVPLYSNPAKMYSRVGNRVEWHLNLSQNVSVWEARGHLVPLHYTPA
jgi:hypothetical protein